MSTQDLKVLLRRATTGENVQLPASTVQLLEGALEIEGAQHSVGAVIPLHQDVQAQAIGTVILMITTTH